MGWQTDSKGTRYNYQPDGSLNDPNNPSIIYANGVEVYYFNNKCHRDNDLPAQVGPVNAAGIRYEIWMQNGEYHRENGPAIKQPDGTEIYQQHGKRHRLDGPAFIGPMKNEKHHKEWWVKGKLHRLDGPATEVYGRNSWFVNGKQMKTFNIYLDYLTKNKLVETKTLMFLKLKYSGGI
jgi:hypothetical protein